MMVAEPAPAIETARPVELRNARLPRWTFIAPALAALAGRLATGAQPIDDAFITFRYARNLAEGVGLVYNPGEVVLGTTAPLWALILAAGYGLGVHDLPWLASTLSAVFDAGSAALLCGLALRLGWSAPGAVLIGMAWAINPMSIAFAVGGMETSLFVLVMLVALTLAATRATGRVRLAALLAGVGVVIRPESLLAALAIVGWSLLARRSETPRLALLAATPALATGAMLLAVYGSPLPNSVAAKQVAYQLSSPFENLFAILITAGLPGWSNQLLAVLPTGVGFLLAALGLSTLAYLVWLGLTRLERQHVSWQPFAVFFVLCVAFYTLIGLRGVRMFSWYLVPLVPLLLLGAAAGLARLAAPRRQWWLAALLVVWQVPAIDWQRPWLPVGHQLVREKTLFEAGRDLRASLPATALVAAPEIGAVGYASNLRILDTVGLVSPSALAYYPLPAAQSANDNAIPPRLIEDQRPDAIVTLDTYARNSLLPDPAFQRDYHFERSYPAAVWASQEVLVFRRNEP